MQIKVPLALLIESIAQLGYLLRNHCNNNLIADLNLDTHFPESSLLSRLKRDCELTFANYTCTLMDLEA